MPDSLQLDLLPHADPAAEPDEVPFRDVAALATKARAWLRDLYFADGRPWVVAYSGGKDSTLVLQLVVETLLELGPEAPRKPLFVISSDTRVEAPVVVDYVENALRAIKRFGDENGLRIECDLVRPTVAEGFWAKLIGLGYPPPTRWFRWCTTSMKIKPSRRAIDAITREHGSVILLLGSRSSESSDRSKRMAGRMRNSRDLNVHNEIPNAYVATPIGHWSTDEVWEYLFENNPPPWDEPHDTMLTLYRQAGGGECPVVMDLNTPSCGGSRFGCWTCTVVKLDRSMEGFIQSGETWMEPLNRYRNMLKEIRENARRRLPYRRDGSKGPGPFNPETRKLLLQELLETEQTLARNGYPMVLVTDEEIVWIQRTWSEEFDLCESALRIARSFGRQAEERAAMDLMDEEDRELSRLCGEYGVNEDLIRSILALEKEYPDLTAWGAKADLKRDLERLITTAVRQAEMADPTLHDAA